MQSDILKDSANDCLTIFALVAESFTGDMSKLCLRIVDDL